MLAVLQGEDQLKKKILVDQMKGGSNRKVREKKEEKLPPGNWERHWPPNCAFFWGGGLRLQYEAFWYLK